MRTLFFICMGKKSKFEQKNIILKLINKYKMDKLSITSIIKLDERMNTFEELILWNKGRIYFRK